jgi:DNA-binding transcriptional regulator GbsR (MarR family)
MELAARLFQRLGLPRSTGQVYGVLFSSPKPLSLEDIADILGISKTSASSGTRQLLALSMIRQAWIPGERRDHFEARTDLREVLRTNYHVFVKPRLDEAEKRIGDVRSHLEADRAKGRLSKEAYTTAQARLESLIAMQHTLRKVLPLAEGML